MTCACPGTTNADGPMSPLRAACTAPPVAVAALSLAAASAAVSRGETGTVRDIATCAVAAVAVASDESVTPADRSAE